MKPILATLLAAMLTLAASAQTHQRVPNFDDDYNEQPTPNPEMLRTPNRAFTQVIIRRGYQGGRMDTTEVFSVRYNALGLPLEMKEFEYNDDPEAKEEPFNRIATYVADGSSTEYTYDAKGNMLGKQDYELLAANSFGAVYMTLINMYRNEMSLYSEDPADRERNKQRLLRTVDSLITNGTPEIRTPGDDEHYEYNTDGNPLYRYSVQNKNNYRYTYEYDPKGRVSIQKAIYTSNANGGRPYVSAIQHQFTYTPEGKLWGSYTYTSETDTNDFVSNQTLRLQKIFHYNAKGLPDTIDYLVNFRPTRHTIIYRDTLQTQYTITSFDANKHMHVIDKVIYYTYKNNVLDGMKTVAYENGRPESYEREEYIRGKWSLPTQVLTYRSETGNASDEWLVRQDLFFYGDKKQDAKTYQLAMTSPREVVEPVAGKSRSQNSNSNVPQIAPVTISGDDPSAIDPGMPAPPPPLTRGQAWDAPVAIDPGVVAAPPPTQPQEQQERFFVYVEQMPEYPGGDEAMRRFLSENIRYPEAARENGTAGKVIVKFVVRADGSITNIQVTRGIGDGCDEEAVRVIKMMPKWKPGRQNGMAVDVYYTVPITFALAGD